MIFECPHCKEWTLWRGEIYDRCLYCGEFLENEAFIKKVEQEIRTQVKEENDIFHINDDDSRFTKISKRFLRRFRKLIVFAMSLMV